MQNPEFWFLLHFSDPQNQGLAIRRLSNWQIILPQEKQPEDTLSRLQKTVTEKHVGIFVSMKL